MWESRSLPNTFLLSPQPGTVGGSTHFRARRSRYAACASLRSLLDRPEGCVGVVIDLFARPQGGRVATERSEAAYRDLHTDAIAPGSHALARSAHRLTRPTWERAGQRCRVAAASMRLLDQPGKEPVRETGWLRPRCACSTNLGRGRAGIPGDSGSRILDQPGDPGAGVDDIVET